MKLTTTRLFLGLFALTAVAVSAGLLWLRGQEEEPQEIRGPSKLIQKLKDRQRQITEEEIRGQALRLEQATHDLGLSDAHLSGAAVK